MAIESYQNMMDPKEIFDQRVRMRSHMIPPQILQQKYRDPYNTNL